LAAAALTSINLPTVHPLVFVLLAAAAAGCKSTGSDMGETG
jgi:hypothetical protein